MRGAVSKGLSAALLALVALPAAAQVSLNALDTPSTQSFDTLPSTGSATWTSNSTIPGWYSVRSGTGTGIAADAGSANAGNLYSYGAASSSERALGALPSSNAAAGNFYHGVRLLNNTGSTITSLDVAYAGEQWRNSAAAAQSLTFSYLVGSPGVTGNLAEFQLAGTAVPALDFISPVTGGSAGALNGNAAANRVALGATITGLSIPDGTEIMLRWADPRQGTSHGLAIDDFSVTPHGTGATVPALSIDDVAKNEGHSGTTPFTFTVSLSAAAATDVSFEVATADGTAAAPADYTAVPTTTLTIPAGQTSKAFDVLVNGDTAVEADETFFVDLANPTGGATIARARGTGTIVNDDIVVAIRRIHEIQGSGAISPLAGQTVTIEAVVTANVLGAGKLNGFFLQEEDVNTDADPATSEGLFVFCSACAANAVAEGQRVRVTGTVAEFQGATQVTATSAATVVVTDAGNHLAAVTPATVSLPLAANVDVNAYYEARESMLVTYDTPLTVSEYFQLFRFGQIQLVAGDRPRQFTENNAPDAAGYAAHLDALARRTVILDDDTNFQNAPLSQPDGTQAVYHPHANGGLSTGTQGTDFFRGGDRVESLTGVLHWSWPGFGDNTWRIRPSASYPVAFTVANPRPAEPPAVGGSIRAVGMNLLNYFTTLTTSTSTTTGPCGPGANKPCRGANTAAELARQRERASNVVCSLNPDVAGFMELENSAPHTTAIGDLLGAVNARCGGAHPYRFVDTGGTLGPDVIRVMLVYREGILAPFGTPKTDLDAIHNRPPTAQTFDVVDPANPAAGKRFTVVANHFKSKGDCPSGGGADADNSDGQGCWAAKRTQQASRLLAWLDGTVVPAAQSTDVLLLGDFNAYASEPAVTTLKGAGYRDLETDFQGAAAYTYLFGGQLGHLDYAFASGSLRAQAIGAGAWHINADESDLFDYNDGIRDPGEATFDQKPNGSALSPARTLWEPDTPYRASDHDPVVVGLFGTAELAVRNLAATPDPVTAGTQLTYTFDVENGGPDAALDATWSDALPPGTTFVSIDGGPGWTCTTPAVGAGGTVGCSRPSFAPGTVSVTLTVAVAASVAGGSTLSNTVTVSSGSGDTLPGDDSATVTTTVAAAPQGHLAIAPTALAFGDQAVGTTGTAQTVTLKNDGTAPLNITALTAASAPFARSGGTCLALPVTLAANASCTLSYTFAPTATGPAAQTVTITADVPGSGTVALSGTGTQGHLAITPTALAFGDQAVGTTGTAQTVTLKNDGTAPLNVTALTAASAPFARSGGTCLALPVTLAANASCTLSYTFAPTATGPAAQTVTVTADVPGGGTVALSGTGTQGRLAIAPTALAFGDQIVGTTSTVRTATLKNEGNAPLNVTALTAAAAPFARAGGTCPPAPILLGPGLECTLGYAFTPSTAGAASQALTVTADVPGSGTLALSGTGTVPQVADVAVAISDDREYAQVGDTLNYVITVTNANGPATASVQVTDALPAGLADGAWTCTPSGGATCTNGSGDTLSSSATLPSGSHVAYVYSATVQAGAPDRLANDVTATVGGGVSDPNTADNQASDTTTIAIFRDGFELDGGPLSLVPYGDGRGFVSALLAIDRTLLDRVGLMPVAIASGVTDDGRTVFTLELARFGERHYLRLTSLAADGRGERGEWQAAELDQPVDLAWQSASAGRSDGYLRIVGGTASLQSTDRGDSGHLVRLRVRTGPDAAPWLSIAPE